MSNIDNLNLENGANNNDLNLENDVNNSTPDTDPSLPPVANPPCEEGDDDCDPSPSCCGSSKKYVTFKACDLCKTETITANLDCAARLLTVKVTVTACKGKRVIVSVKVYGKVNENDDADKQLIRFKAKEIEIIGNDDDCNNNTVEFCFSFVNDACAKTVEEYDIVSNAEYVFTGDC